MTTKLDKKLAAGRKEADGDIEHKIACLKGLWKVFVINPVTYMVAGGVILGYICLGIYFQWIYKDMIGVIFNWGIPSIITGLILEKFKKNKTD